MKRILVPLDLNRLSEAKIPVAEAQARALDAEIILLHVLAPDQASGKRYSQGPHQYAEGEMMVKVIGLTARLLTRPLDILITHGPPAGVHEGPDRAHRGLRAVRRASAWMRARLHGHVRPYESLAPKETSLGSTRVINVFGHRVLNVAPRPGSIHL